MNAETKILSQLSSAYCLLTYLPTIYPSPSTLGVVGLKLQIYTTTDLALAHYYIKGTRVGDSNKNINYTILLIIQNGI